MFSRATNHNKKMRHPVHTHDDEQHQHTAALQMQQQQDSKPEKQQEEKYITGRHRRTTFRQGRRAGREGGGRGSAEVVGYAVR